MLHSPGARNQIERPCQANQNDKHDVSKRHQLEVRWRRFIMHVIVPYSVAMTADDFRFAFAGMLGEDVTYFIMPERRSPPCD